MSADLSQRQALIQLGAATAEAVARTLDMLAPGAVERGEVSVPGEGHSPFTNLPEQAVAASISYVDGVTGANVLIMSQAAARGLAQAMGVPAEGSGHDPLSELEMSAVGEAANQTLAAAAAATSVVIGQEIEISPPDVRLVSAHDEFSEIYPAAPYACATSFTVSGESCRLIQLVPSAFVVRMARAIEERSFEVAGDPTDTPEGGDEAAALTPVSVSSALSETRLRVWVELGRAEMPLGDALELPAGALLELDRTTEAPVDLFVNGLCFGTGRLLVTDDGEWAIEVETVASATARPIASLAFAGIAGASPLESPQKGTN